MPTQRRSREIEQLVRSFIRRLTAAAEVATSARARVLGQEYLRTAALLPGRPRATLRASSQLPSPAEVAEPDAVEPSPPVQSVQPDARRVRPKRERPAPASGVRAPIAIDPEEERRAAEFARLRALLRPAAPVPPVPPVMTAAAPPPPSQGNDSLQALEDRIRGQIPALPGLSQSRYTAQIASWVGRVRLHQSGPDGERTRIASRMLFEKLRNLAWSMEAGTIEALNTSWSTRNWERYIRDNEVLAETPEAPPPPKTENDADTAVWATVSETGYEA